MFPRLLRPQILRSLEENAAVALLGPRQVGKTTLALEIGKQRDAVYVDLESENGKAKLREPILYLQQHLGRLVILDEVQRAPHLFSALRGWIDEARRQGHAHGQLLLLGSASLELIQHSSESLAGRVEYLELAPLTVLEAADVGEDLWLRGGFPESLCARTYASSMRWRMNFIRTYLERDIPQLGPRIPAETLRRFWAMLAHRHGTLLNAAEIARALGVDGKTVARYLDLLVDLLLVRRLPPWHANVGKRLVRSPKVYLRDSGMMHALLGIGTHEALLAHPSVGASWEGFVLENLLAVLPHDVTAYFYRTQAGAEIDLILDGPSVGRWAVEVKRSLDPTPRKGFHLAAEDVRPTRKLVVYPGLESFPLGHETEAIGLGPLCRELQQLEPSV